MARYQVFRNRDGEGYLLDVQNEFLEDLNVRVVVPLMPPHAAPKPARRLNPAFEIDGRQYLMVTQYISAVMLADLGASVGSLRVHGRTINEALDMLCKGF